MFKKNTIATFMMVVFLVLILAPYFMINCTEPDGNNHIENVFNRCCPSMHGMNHQPASNKEAALSNSHCKCSVNLSSEEYLPPHSEKILVNQEVMTYSTEIQSKPGVEKNLLSYKSESPPLSLDLVISTVLLI